MWPSHIGWISNYEINVKVAYFKQTFDQFWVKHFHRSFAPSQCSLCCALNFVLGRGTMASMKRPFLSRLSFLWFSSAYACTIRTYLPFQLGTVLNSFFSTVPSLLLPLSNPSGLPSSVCWFWPSVLSSTSFSFGHLLFSDSLGIDAFHTQ